MTVVTNLSSLLNVIDQLRSSHNDQPLIFRGEASEAWDLLPKASRAEFHGPNWESSFQAWRSKVRELKKLPGNEWRQLALAQHHGFATPLLDWSCNPLVAAFFAVDDRKEPKQNGAIYCFQPAFRWDPSTNKGRLKDLKSVLGLSRQRMPYPVLEIERFSGRLVAQSALFTVHPDDSVCMKNADWPFTHEMDGEPSRIENLTVLMIPNDKKVSFRRELEIVDITPSRLFPDLDGVSEEINRLLRLTAARYRRSSNTPMQRPAAKRGRR